MMFVNSFGGSAGAGADWLAAAAQGLLEASAGSATLSYAPRAEVADAALVHMMYNRQDLDARVQRVRPPLISSRHS